MTLPWVTACHEAAHCVAALLCGEFVYQVVASRKSRVVIDRRGREIGPVFGLVETSLNPSPPDIVTRLLADDESGDQRRQMWRTAVNCIFMDAAGAVAEARIGRRGWSETCVLNRFVAGDLAMALETAAPFISDERERRRTVFRIWDASRPIIGRGRVWSAVEAVAYALQANGGELDGEQVAEAAGAVLGDLPTQDWSRPIVAVEAPTPPLGRSFVTSTRSRV